MEDFKQKDPSEGIQAKESEWRSPSGGILAEGYERTDLSGKIRGKDPNGGI